ncbi:PTS sugar transporter subunit IIA [Fusibacter ferrireducens]|uniref:PTS fructose transporter subunit IIA n=1 Tax=Fusibacter ferrireducens TaxID=2785058 RepID=A0ABR9ZPY1_9FIRM|nr:PTS fructose transporter subunit IIA [Fusibacter ferrireducens]MBF4692522.1 PTS fructose transporter subunit IIA [Fusibacter ferrireducens]
MRSILIATHGYLADGVKSLLSIIGDNQAKITYINAYVDDTPYSDQLSSFFKTTHQDDEIVIFSDLYGGSVNQKLMQYIDSPNVFLISGFNISIILEVLYQPSPLSNKILSDLIENSRQHLQLVKPIEVTEETNSDDFFKSEVIK